MSGRERPSSITGHAVEAEAKEVDRRLENTEDARDQIKRAQAGRIYPGKKEWGEMSAELELIDVVNGEVAQRLWTKVKRTNRSL